MHPVWLLHLQHSGSTSWQGMQPQSKALLPSRLPGSEKISRKEQYLSDPLRVYLQWLDHPLDHRTMGVLLLIAPGWGCEVFSTFQIQTMTAIHIVYDSHHWLNWHFSLPLPLLCLWSPGTCLSQQLTVCAFDRPLPVSCEALQDCPLALVSFLFVFCSSLGVLDFSECQYDS